MQIVIPEELTGSTEYTAASQMSRSLSAMADVFAKQSAQSAQRNRQLDETVGVMQDSNKINQTCNDAVAQYKGMTSYERELRAQSGYDPLEDDARQKIEEERAKITNPIRLALFDRASQRALYQGREKADAIMTGKMKVEAQGALDASTEYRVDYTLNGYQEPKIPLSSDPDAHLEAVARDRRQFMANQYREQQSYLAATVAGGMINQAEAKARDTLFLTNVASGLAAQGRMTEADDWLESNRNAMTPQNYDRAYAKLRQIRQDADVSNLKAYLNDRHVINPVDPYNADGMETSPLERAQEAVKEATSPGFAEGYGPDTVKRVQAAVIGQYAEQRDQYRNKLPEVLGGLLSDVMNRKITSEQLMNDHNFRYLNYPEKTNVRNFTEAVQRADAAEAVQEGSLNMKERQEIWRKQQKDAVNKAGEIRTNIARGLYANPAEMLPEYSRSDNPLILKQYPQAMAEYKLIQGNRDLKANLERIATAADQGVLHADGPDQNMAARGSLQDDLMDMYKSDNTFRGDKMEKWVKEKIQEMVKKAVGQLLDRQFPLIPVVKASEEQGGIKGGV